MEIISWGMMNLGVDDLPSISGLKDMVDALQQRYGIRTTCYSGTLGHIYYVNSLADQIAQVCAHFWSLLHWRVLTHFIPL